MNHLEYDSLIEELEVLRESSESAAVIVEGKRDMAALRALGVRGRIYALNDGRALLETCELIAGEYRDVILMVDLDRAGRLLAAKLKRLLSEKGVRINERHRISLLRKLDTHQVEHMYTRFRRIQAELGAGDVEGV
ncbi:MAG: toprim domain-containing protein [Euryarchaeota archaeon]|nr:toprim domain-containing protein [Euryarchaeota archaeon]